MKPLKGQCLCGAIQYEIDKVEPKMAHCHCSMCRKFHGAAFSTFVEVKTDDLRWLKGQELLVGYIASNGTVRQFCSVCGSSMTFNSAHSTGNSIAIALGTLDSDFDFQPDAHIHVDSKAKWINICDDLPQFAKERDEKLI